MLTEGSENLCFVRSSTAGVENSSLADEEDPKALDCLSRNCDEDISIACLYLSELFQDKKQCGIMVGHENGVLDPRDEDRNKWKENCWGKERRREKHNPGPLLTQLVIVVPQAMTPNQCQPCVAESSTVSREEDEES